MTITANKEANHLHRIHARMRKNEKPENVSVKDIKVKSNNKNCKQRSKTISQKPFKARETNTLTQVIHFAITERIRVISPAL